MESLNDYLGDPLYPFIGGDVIITADGKRIMDEGVEFSGSIDYQIFKFIDMGFSSSYIQQSTDISLRFLVVPYPEFPEYNYSFNSTNRINVSAFSFGINSSFRFSDFLGFHKSSNSLIKRLDIATRLSCGYSSMTFDERRFLLDNLTGDTFKGHSVYGKSELGISYRIGKDFFSSIGVKAGYQIMKTENLKDRSNNEAVYGNLDAPKRIGLDFSGFYYGLFLTFGK